MLDSSFERAKATAVRQLLQGESFEVLEGPKAEKGDKKIRIHVRLPRDGTTGWFTMRPGETRPWSSRLQPTQALELKAEDGELVRQLMAGETIEALEAPTKVDDSENESCTRVRAESDGAVGFVTVVVGLAGKA